MLIGNFGREPVDANILSASSRARMEKDGPCTTYVEVPMEDGDSKRVTFQTTVIFHPPILHAREIKKVDVMNRPYRRSYKI